MEKFKLTPDKIGTIDASFHFRCAVEQLGNLKMIIYCVINKRKLSTLNYTSCRVFGTPKIHSKSLKSFFVTVSSMEIPTLEEFNF